MNFRKPICWGLLLVMFVAGQAWSQGIDTTDPTLPPDGVYLTPTDVHAMYTGPALAIVLNAIQHRPFKTPPVQRSLTPDGHEIEEFNSSLHGEGTCEGAACPLSAFPVDMTGPVQTIVYNKGTATTGTFDTEILSMDLTGPGLPGVVIRESPTLPSLGETTITDIGGGNYHIDSFFDVWTEISLDGGLNWIPSGGSTHVQLVPEPSGIVLIAWGLLGLAGLARRRR